jgi:hypothetical protein
MDLLQNSNSLPDSSRAWAFSLVTLVYIFCPLVGEVAVYVESGKKSNSLWVVPLELNN